MPKHRHIHVHLEDGFEESKHPRASNGQFGSGSTGSSAPQAKSSPKEVKQMIRARTGHQLMSVLKNQNTDPKVRELIEEELDDRTSRGWPMDKPNP